MNTSIFDNCVGKKYSDIVNLVGSDWHIVHDDAFVHVFRNDNKAYVAILSSDDDGVVRFCDVQKNKKSIYLYNGIYGNMRNYADVRFVLEVESMCSKYPELPVCVKLDQKQAIRNVYRRKREAQDHYSVPLLNSSKQWRTVSDNNGEDCTDFIIIPDKWTSEQWETEDGYAQIMDEIEEFIFYTVGYRSGYDFPTGKMITLSWGAHKVPCGVAIVHHRGIDW